MTVDGTELRYLIEGEGIPCTFMGADEDPTRLIHFEVTRLADGLHLVTAPLFKPGGTIENIAVAHGEEGTVVVDSHMAQLTPKMLEAIATFTDKPPSFVINTHWHFDHVGGNENLADLGALIVAHDSVRQRMSVDQVLVIGDGRSDIPASPDNALPVVTFTQSVTFYLNGEVIDVLYVGPAHTDGDAIVHFRNANVIHVGDIFFNPWYPFVDQSSGGSVEGILRAIRVALKRSDADTQIIPSHGLPADKQTLQDYGHMLETISERITALIAEGKTLEEIHAAEPSREFDARWGGGPFDPEAFVEQIHGLLIDDP